MLVESPPDDLRAKVDISIHACEDLDETCWDRSIGVLITANQAKAIISYFEGEER